MVFTLLNNFEKIPSLGLTRPATGLQWDQTDTTTQHKPKADQMSFLQNAVVNTLGRWEREALHGFIAHVAKGGETERQHWVHGNGKHMVGPVGAPCNRFVELDVAISEWKRFIANGQKIVV